jgi:hypothetical protein
MAHKLRAAPFVPHQSGAPYVCSCGRSSYNVKHYALARAAHSDHVVMMRARELLDNCLTDLDVPGLGSDLDSILDWAERDQNECRQCGDIEGEREAKANLRTIRRMRDIVPALLLVAGYSGRKS